MYNENKHEFLGMETRAMMVVRLVEWLKLDRVLGNRKESRR